MTPTRFFVFTHTYLLCLGAAVCLAVVPCRAASAASEPLRVTVAVEANWPPMEFVDDQGTIVGFSVDYVNAVAREAGLAAVHISVPWDEIFDGLQTGAYDIVASSVSITPEREASMDFSIPYYDVRQAFVAPAETAVRRPADLAGRRLGVQIATTGHYAAERIPGLEIVPFAEIGMAFAALETGALDGVVADDPVASNYILRQPADAPKMKIGFFLPAGEPEYYGFAVAKGNVRLLERLNRGIRRVQDKGIDGALHRKWIGF